MTDAQLMAHFARLEGGISIALAALAGLLSMLPASKGTDDIRAVLVEAAADLSKMASDISETVQ